MRCRRRLLQKKKGVGEEFSNSCRAAVPVVCSSVPEAEPEDVRSRGHVFILDLTWGRVHQVQTSQSEQPR